MDISKEASIHLIGIIVLILGLYSLVTGRMTFLSGSSEDSDYVRQSTLVTGPKARLAAAVLVALAIALLLDHTSLGIGLVAAFCIITVLF